MHHPMHMHMHCIYAYTCPQVMKALEDNKEIEHIGLFGNHDNMERRHAHNSPWVARSHPTEPPACLGPPFWAQRGESSPLGCR